MSSDRTPAASQALNLDLRMGADVEPMQIDPNPVIINLETCDRCGRSHRGCKFEALTRQTSKFTHYYTCPIIGEPVMLAINPPDVSDAILRRMAIFNER